MVRIHNLQLICKCVNALFEEAERLGMRLT